MGGDNFQKGNSEDTEVQIKGWLKFFEVLKPLSRYRMSSYYVIVNEDGSGSEPLSSHLIENLSYRPNAKGLVINRSVNEAHLAIATDAGIDIVLGRYLDRSVTDEVTRKYGAQAYSQFGFMFSEYLQKGNFESTEGIRRGAKLLEVINFMLGTQVVIVNEDGTVSEPRPVPGNYNTLEQMLESESAKGVIYSGSAMSVEMFVENSGIDWLIGNQRVRTKVVPGIFRNGIWEEISMIDDKPITIRGKISADRQRYSKSSERICKLFLERNKISENVEKMDANGIKYYDIQWSDRKYAKYANSSERTSTQEKYYGADSYGAKTEEEWKFAKIRLFEILKKEGFGWRFMKDKFKNTPAISSTDASYLRIKWREL
jgi:hypothetical protein